ncbi:hypothetical protein MTO96_030266 [Rhipicephalus appendiculatus]
MSPTEPELADEEMTQTAATPPVCKRKCIISCRDGSRWTTRDPVLPLDVVYSRRELEELKEESSYFTVVRERLQKARELAATHIRRAQEKQKQHFDKHHRDVVFETGQLVLLKAPPSGVKTTTSYTGPHKIVNKLSPANYEIELADNMGSDIVHVEKLRPYLSPIAHMEQPSASD